MSEHAEQPAAQGAEAKKPPRKGNRKVLIGKVVSNKMKKTIVVAITHRKLHRLYRKYTTVTKKVKAHDERNEGGIGDTVSVIESRPLSRDKRWRLYRILERAK